MALRLRIRELREAKGLPLEALAARIGCSTPHLSQLERGIKNLNNTHIERLSLALEVEPFELFAPRQQRDALAQIFAQLSEGDRARVEAFAAALASTRKTDSE